MIITKIEIDGFGGLSNFQLELNDGIQVFYGDNGTGKSTLALFVRVMLYGMPNERKKEGIPLRQRILPLEKSLASGRLVVKTRGRPLEISRSFGISRRSDRLAMTWLDDGSSLHTSLVPGEFLLDINEETFVRTFFLGELGHAVLPGNVSQLNSRLMNLSVTGTEDMDYQQAMKRLKEEQRAISSPRGAGSLDALLKKEGELKADLADRRRLEEDLRTLEERLNEDGREREAIKKKHSETLEALESLEKLKELEDYEEAMVLLSRKQDLEQRIQSKESPWTKEQAGDLKHRLDVYLEEDRDLSRAVSEHNEYSQRLARREEDFSEVGDRLFHESNLPVIRELTLRKSVMEKKVALLNLDSENYKELEQSFTAWRSSRRMGRYLTGMAYWLLPLPILLYVIYRGLAFENYIMAGGSLFILMLYGFLFFKGRNWLTIRLTGDEEAIRLEMESLLGSRTAEELLDLGKDPEQDLATIRSEWLKEREELTREVQKLGLSMDDLEEYVRDQARYQEAKASWQKDMAELKSSFDGLSLRVKGHREQEAVLQRELLPAELEPDAAGRSELSRLESRMEIRGEEERELEGVLKQLELISLERNLNPLLLEPQPLKKEDIKAELDLKRRLKAESDTLKEQLQTLELGIIRKEEQKKSLEGKLTGIRPEAALSELHGEIQRQRGRKDVLELALVHLEESFLEIQRDYLPRVSQRVSELFERLTGGAYTKVLLTGDYRMKVKLNGELVDMAYLSRGTLDLLWLGLRLALCDIIISGEKAPLIFDDSFIHLDEDRLTSILTVLHESFDGQIIILTCHHRESLLMGEMDQGH